MASRTLQQIRATDRPSPGSDANSTHDIKPQSTQKDYLGLIDIAKLAKLQISISGPVGRSSPMGSPSSIGTLLLGEGGSFVVRRVSNSAFTRPLDSCDETFDKKKGFVVVKQPSVREIGEDDFENRLYDAMMELKVSYHEPLRMHPNIVHLHSFMWDIQSNNADVLAPSLIMEYADLGTVSDFQDSKRLILHSDAKLQICLDVAEGLSFLHQCSIIHGDVKCENIFLFRDRMQDNNKATAIRAKVGDFGSALIGVLEDSSCPKQKFRGYSPPWDPPEKAEELDALGLWRMEMYCYGLAIWRIMCNGEFPYNKLFWDYGRENVTLEPSSTPAKSLSIADFIALKQKGNNLLRLAIETIKNRPTSDVAFEKTQQVLNLTLCIDPASRAAGFDEIVKILRPKSSKTNILPRPKPEPLKAGDFGITDSRFPHFLYLIRTTPASFRSLICEQLTQYAQKSETKAKRALYHLALGICHWQKFYSSSGSPKIYPSSNLDFLRAGAEEILEAADLGHPIAQSLAPKALSFSRSYDRISRTELQEWLINSMQHGSIRARNELRKNFPTKFSEAVATIKEMRQKAATFLTADETTPYAVEFFDSIPGLDPSAKLVLCQPGVKRLHQAAYLGADLVCRKLVENDHTTIDAVNSRGETALHYATRNGQSWVVQYLLGKGANINAQRDHGAGALHMAFCSYDTETMLSLLLERGANPELSSSGTLDQLPDRSDFCMVGIGTPLHLSIRCEYLGAALVLLKYGANPNHKVEFAGSALRVGLQMHSMAILDFLMPWAIKNVENLPVVHELYSSLVGFYAQPMYRYLYWGDEKSLRFILPAMECLKRYGLAADERVLLSWAMDADDCEVADYYLNKFFSMGEHMLQPFRDPRVSDTGEPSNSKDFPLSPDLKDLLSVVISISSKEMVQIVLRYTKKPLSSCNNFGYPFLCQVGFRQTEPREYLDEIVSWLIEAGVDVKATGAVRGGPLQNAVVWNNSNLADVLLDYELSFKEVQAAMQSCVMKGNSLTAERIMRSIFRKYPQILTLQLPKQEFDVFHLVTERFDPNYLRAICSRPEFSQQKNLHAGILREAIQCTKQQPGGRLALKERLSEFGFLLMTPLHYTAKNANVEAAQILLEEGANINAYSIYPAKGFDIDTSTFTCTSDLSGLNDNQKNWLLANSGPTPLDEAYDRDWEMSLYQWLSSDQNLLMEFRLAGGANKEEDEYEERTQTMINFLKANGAKTRCELFGQPESRQRERNARLKDSRKLYKKKNEQRPSSDTSRRIFRFWGAACALHSAQMTLREFPDLSTRVEPTRPRYSKLFADSISQFLRILSSTSELLDDERRAGIESELSGYRTWAQKIHLEEGELDEIADIPSPSLSMVLSASIFVSLREIVLTLRYIEELLAEPQTYIDRSDRYKELLSDLSKAIEVLTSEEMSFKILSNQAVVEIEEKLHISMKDVDLEGNLKRVAE